MSVFLRLPYIIFQGGMPRASYGDRHSISVIHGSKQTAFDFTSRVIDFFVICNADPAAGMWWEEGTPSLLKSKRQPGVAVGGDSGYGKVVA